MLKKIINWIEVRIGLNELIRTHLTGYLIPANINIFHTLGLVALAGFIVQVLTGVLLLPTMCPSPIMPSGASRTS
jgi:ubiquinol-cytochrome c reductase cytochrome b subunit